MSDPLKAVEYYRQIIKEDPTSAYADSSLFRIGMLYYILGDFEKTIDHFELIFKKGEQSNLYKKTCYWLKFCYENIGDSSKAKRMEGILNRILSADEKQNEEIEEKPKEQIVEKTEVGHYTIQLGAYEDKKWLEYFLAKLKENNVEYFIRESGQYSKICSGKFGMRSDAEKYLEEIKSKGFHGFITFDTNP
jgi:tetratricopeptide (TPR) repeat protein